MGSLMGVAGAGQAIPARKQGVSALAIIVERPREACRALVLNGWRRLSQETILRYRGAQT